MDLDELQRVRDAERSTDSLQGLSESFYADVADHIADLKEQRDRAAERADDPFGDPEVQQLTGEIDATEQVVESIYERRVGKLVKLASFAAADMPADEEGLTTEERALFSDLVDRIEDNRTRVLDELAAEEPTEPAQEDEPIPDSGARDAAVAEEVGLDAEPDPMDGSSDPGDAGTGIEPESESESGSEPEVSAADLMGEEGHTPEPAGPDRATVEDERDGEPDTGSESGVERVTLRITRDVGEIVGIDDREYDLTTEDVVTLPETNAAPLVQRDAAERLE